jgi:hypothetical protein
MASQSHGPRGQSPRRSNFAASQAAATGHSGDSGRRGAAAVLRRLALKLAAIGTLTAILSMPFVDADLAPSALLMLYAVAAGSACSILVTARAVQHNDLRDGFETAFASAVLAGALTATVTGSDARMFSIAVAVFLLGAALAGLNFALQRVAAPSASAVTVYCLTGVAATSPLWAGPLVEVFPSPWLAAAAVAASPLSFFAAAADFDYLRTEWFYRFSAIGTLRYEYPSFLAFSCAYVLPITGAVLLARHGATSPHSASTLDPAHSERSTTT